MQRGARSAPAPRRDKFQPERVRAIAPPTAACRESATMRVLRCQRRCLIASLPLKTRPLITSHAVVQRRQSGAGICPLAATRRLQRRSVTTNDQSSADGG